MVKFPLYIRKDKFLFMISSAIGPRGIIDLVSFFCWMMILYRSPHPSSSHLKGILGRLEAFLHC